MMIRILSVLCFSVTLFCAACGQVAIPEPYGPVPSRQQLEWQKMEYYMFVHFGPNTFTGVEWGDGSENPDSFNPSSLDCRQWASTAKAAGMKGIIITAKHHDGFCLWPSLTSTHTVKESSWRGGKGDVLKELSQACREYGLKFGVYLSPWDRNHPAYGTPEYNKIFAQALTEVHTAYGPVFEQWFDGACGGQMEFAYDWELFIRTVYSHQPNAILFSDVGPGCRWIGNEQGVAGETNWSRLTTDGFTPGKGAPATEILNTGQAGGKYWIPGEADVSIRPGWFYSPDTDREQKTVESLMDIYYTSVGRNASLLLNVPPDRQGRIHRPDSLRLMEFRHAREKAFSRNLARGARIYASAVRNPLRMFAPKQMLDGKYDTYWTTDDSVSSACVIVILKHPEQVEMLLIQEYIPLGQRINGVTVECYDTRVGAWVRTAEATTVGYKRILRFPAILTDSIRIHLNARPVCPVINTIEIY